MKPRIFTDFEHLPEAYVHLFKDWGSHCFYYSVAWFRNFVQNALDEGDQVRIYALESEEPASTPVVALATRHNTQTSGYFKSLRLSALSNYYTSAFGPVLQHSGHEIREVVGELARAICSDTLEWDVVDLRPLDVDSPVFDALVKAFQSEGMVVQTYFCFGNWYLQVQGQSYQRYFETLPAALRNTLQRKRKKLEKLGRARIEIITGPEGVEGAIEAYQKVYRSSWKVPEPYPFFTPGLIRRCAELGWLRLGLVYVDDEPVAAQFWIVNGAHATIYKLAHDERFAELSAGSVLTARLMEHVIEVDKVQEVDFGSGDDPYKRTWLPQRRERWGMMALNPRTLHGILGIVRHIGGRAVKNSLRSLLRRRQNKRQGSGPDQAAAESDLVSGLSAGLARPSRHSSVPLRWGPCASDGWDPAAFSFPGVRK